MNCGLRFSRFFRAARFAPVSISLIALVVSGCAHSSDEIAAREVSPTTFQAFECEQIADEAQRVSTRMAELKTEVDETADDDELMTTVGILVFPPLLFFIKGDGVEAEEYGRLKGEYATMQSVAIQKNCPPISPV